MTLKQVKLCKFKLTQIFYPLVLTICDAKRTVKTLNPTTLMECLLTTQNLPATNRSNINLIRQANMN